MSDHLPAERGEIDGELFACERHGRSITPFRPVSFIEFKPP
jgi:hypothetical protein